MKINKFFSRIMLFGLAVFLVLVMHSNINVSAERIKRLETNVGASVMPAINYIADNFGIKLNSIHGQPGNIDIFIDDMRDLGEISDLEFVEIKFFYKDPQHISYIKYIFEELIAPRWVENGKSFSVQFFDEGKRNSNKKSIKGSCTRYKK